MSMSVKQNKIQPDFNLNSTMTAYTPWKSLERDEGDLLSWWCMIYGVLISSAFPQDFNKARKGGEAFWAKSFNVITLEISTNML